MSKIKIAFFLDVMREDFDGVAITMHQVIRRIPRDQFDAIFITPQPPENDIGFPILDCPYFVLPEKGKEYRVALPGSKRSLLKELDRFKPDIVHFSSPTFLGQYAKKYAKKRCIPVTTIYHTHYPSFVEYYFKRATFLIRPFQLFISSVYAIYKGCDMIFAPTLSMKKYLQSNCEISSDSVSVWGRGVDNERFNPKHRQPDFWSAIPEDGKKVLFVSRLVREKEPDTLIRLYQILEQEGHPFYLIIVGEGPYRGYLESKMPKAHFTGALYGDDLAKAYASADVFVFPSTTETFGNVVLEAMASGLPVVAANAGGPSNIVKDGTSGYLVEPRNEKAFYEKIDMLMKSDDLRVVKSQAALRYAESQSWIKLSNQLFNQYKEIIKTSKGATT